MYVSRVEAEETLPFKKIGVDFPATGTTLILGEFKAFTGCSSNGSGKSSLINIIALAWYGRTLDGDKLSACKRNDAKYAYVGSEMRGDDVLYRVERYHQHSKHGSTVRFWIDGKEHTQGTPKLTDALIDKTVGDYDRFAATSAYAAQTDAATFYLMSDGDKKRFLERMFDLAWVGPARENAKEELRELERQYDEHRLKTDWWKDEIAVSRADKREAVEALEGENYPRQIRKARKSLHKLRSELPGIEKKLATAKRIAKNAESNEDLSTYQFRVEKRARDLAEHRAQLGEAKRLLERGEPARERILARIEESKQGKCEACGNPLPPKRIKRQLKSLEAELSEYGTNLDVAAMEVISHRRAIKAILREGEIPKPELMVDPDEAKEHCRTVRRLHQSHTDAIEQATESIRMLKRLRKRHRRAVETAVEAIRKGKKALRLARNERDATKGRLELAQFWVEGFGDKGIKAFVLESYYPTISARASAYASRLFGAKIEIRISPTSALKSKKGEASEKINIDISIPGCSRTYKRASKAQKRRLDLAILLAIGQVVESLRPATIRHTFVDELFDGMDDVGIETAGALLMELGRDRPIVVVSHEDRLKAKADHVIRVIHHGDHATVK